jgi:Domain of unknown function (DUF4337)
MPELIEAPEGQAHEKELPFMLPVAVTLAILAVLVSIATLMGHRAATEMLVAQTKVADQWAYYQAKNVRFRQMEVAADMFGALMPADKAKAEALQEKYTKEAERYDKEKDEAAEQSKDLEAERNLAGRKEDRFDGGEVLLEIALIVCSLTLLTKKKAFWLAGMLIGVIGVVVTGSGFLLH